MLDVDWHTVDSYKGGGGLNSRFADSSRPTFLRVRYEGNDAGSRARDLF